MENEGSHPLTASRITAAKAKEFGDLEKAENNRRDFF